MYSNNIISKGGNFFAENATTFTVISAFADLLGVFVCRFMIKRFTIRFVYFFSYLFTLGILLIFAECGYFNFY